MKKSILLFIVCCFTFSTNANAEKIKESEIEKNNIYWETSPLKKDIIASSYTVATGGRSHDPAKLFDEDIANLFTELILKFDSAIGNVSEKAKYLEVDTLNMSIALSAEGKLYIVSGVAEGSISINLKSKR